ncbi:hypothetical protein, partial [Candidatus Frankia alpina]|uniref:hypothetical protein n=1 Tax=Candidatus Frankia alpina TaxID=2699483 RepID=UPI001A983A2B
MGETSGIKPRKLADPSSALTPEDGAEGGVLLEPEAAKGTTRFFGAGTFSETSPELLNGLFFAAGLG